MSEVQINSDRVAVDASDLAKNYYVEYGTYVNKTRALPSVYDGFKLVHRRIVYIANQLPEKLMKTAELSGKIMTLHPHGDSSGSIVSLARPTNRLPLMTTKGNFGGPGYGAASSRYTECYLSHMARLMYCQFKDYANYIEGEIEHDEPEALPCLIPYALIEGYDGMGIGVATRNLTLDVMDLIEYYKDVVRQGYSDRLVKPDLGAVIINMTDEELKESVKAYSSRISVYSQVFQESDSVLVLSGLGDRLSIDRVLKKLNDLISTEKVDFRNESTTYERYVFEIMSKDITPQYLKSRLEKATTSNDTFKRVMTEKGDAIYCSLDYVVSKSLELLNQAIDKKIAKDISDLEYKLELANAMTKAKNSDVFDNIKSKSRAQLEQDIMDLGITPELAKVIASKPIYSLTNTADPDEESYRAELNKLKSHNRVDYLIGLYDELKELVAPIYNARHHSVLKSQLLEDPRAIYKKGVLEIGNSRNGYPFDNYIFIVNSEGKVFRVAISSSSAAKLDTSQYGKIVGISSDKYPKIVIQIRRNGYIYALGFDGDSYKYDKVILNKVDGDEVYKVTGYESGSEPEYFNSILKSKVSKAIYVESLNQ